MLLTTGLLLAAESTSKHSAEPSTDERSGIDRANFDESVKPGQDFFLHVNGSWIEHNPIPPQYSRWGAFAKLGDDNLLVLRSILEELPNEKGPLDENRRKLRNFYLTAMDQKIIDEQGITPLNDELKRIAQVDSPEALVVELGHLRERHVRLAFLLDQPG